MKKLSIAFLWHMHQPLYKSNDDGGIYLMPWVRLHAVKDYLDMLLIIDNFENLKLNFNFVPVLLDALIDYCSENTHDLHSKLSIKRAEELSDEDKIFILNNFFDANYQNMIQKHKRYCELYKKKLSFEELNIEAFSLQEYSDIMAAFNLVWIDPVFAKNNDEIKGLFEKGTGYSLEDRKRIIAIHREIIRQIIPKYRQYQEKNRIELLTSPYYHPIMPLLLNMKDAKNSTSRFSLPKGDFKMQKDVYEQVENALLKMEQVFGKRPAGIWPSEHCLSEATLKCLSKAKVRYTLSDEGILSSSLKKEFIRDSKGSILNPHALTQVYNFKTFDTNIDIVFRNSTIANLISFEYPLHNTKIAVNDLFERIKVFQTKIENSPDENHLLLVAMDGENSWENFENDGFDFLFELYSMIESDRTLETVLLSEYIEKAKKKNLKTLYPGSWINRNFQLWACESTKNLAWEHLDKAKETLLKAKKHSKVSKANLQKAKEELQIAQGSDWFWWFGEPNDSGRDYIFDYLFRQHLKNVYKLINAKVPAQLDVSLSAFLGKPSRTPRKNISPLIESLSSDFENQWKNAGVIEIPSGPVMEDKKILDRIFYGNDSQKIYFRFDLNSYLQNENSIFNDSYQIFIYFQKASNLNFANIRTLNRNDSSFSTLNAKYNYEIKLSVSDCQCEFAFASNNIWIYKLRSSVECFLHKNILFASVDFDELETDENQSIDFCIITSISDKTENVFPKDSTLTLFRTVSKETVFSGK